MVVKGQNVIRIPFATLDRFRARPGLNGIPLMAPFANRLDEMAFYANGVKFQTSTRSSETSTARSRFTAM